MFFLDKYFYKLIKSIIIGLVVFIAANFTVINPVSANNIPAGFGAGTMIATPSGDVVVEKLQIGDRIIGYNFEIHRDQENTVKEIKQHFSLSYYLINGKTKIASPNLIYVITLIHPKLVRLNKVELGNKLFSKKHYSTVANSIEKSVEPTNIYQIILDNRVGNVYADDILIHVGFELPPYFKNQHVDCQPGTPYFKQCANINAKTLPGFLAAFGMIAIGLTVISKTIDKLFTPKSGKD